MTFLLANWRLVLLAVLMGVIGIQTWRLERCSDAYEAYRVEVKALGAAQEAENARKLVEREKIAHETNAALQKRLSDLGARYKRLHDNPSGGSVSTEPPAPDLASACQPSGEPAGHLARLEAALLDALERADAEMIKYQQLWGWLHRVQ